MKMEFYRYVIKQISGGGYEDDHSGYVKFPSNTELKLETYNLHKETLKGYWIGFGEIDKLHSKPIWISKTSRKRFAYPTKKEALNNLIKRTEIRIGYLSGEINMCKNGLNLAKEQLNKNI